MKYEHAVMAMTPTLRVLTPGARRKLEVRSMNGGRASRENAARQLAQDDAVRAALAREQAAHPAPKHESRNVAGSVSALRQEAQDLNRIVDHPQSDWTARTRAETRLREIGRLLEGVRHDPAVTAGASNEQVQNATVDWSHLSHEQHGTLVRAAMSELRRIGVK